MKADSPGPPDEPDTPSDYRFQPIGIVHSCFREKFGIPRQPGLVREAGARLELLPPFDREETLRGLEGFSHLWILFVFHADAQRGWKPTVRPPRLGGNRRRGVFATRSPFRPNPIGLSAVKLLSITREGTRLMLELGGVDLLDGTPVLDIKPYLPYADRIDEARTDYPSPEIDPQLPIAFSAEARDYLEHLPPSRAADLQRLISGLLRQDPRPAYLAGNRERTSFGMRLEELNVRWTHEQHGILVTDIRPLPLHGSKDGER